MLLLPLLPLLLQTSYLVASADTQPDNLDRIRRVLGHETLHPRSFHTRISGLLQSFLNPSSGGAVPSLMSRIIGSAGGLSKDSGMGILKYISNIKFPSPKKRSRSDNCKSLGGVVLSGKCLQYMGASQVSSFNSARHYCHVKGGELWTPNLRDPFLYQKIMKYLPEVAGAVGEHFWIGAEQVAGKAISLEGEDVTDAYLIQIFNEMPIEGRCFALDFPNGQFKAKDFDCRVGQGFVCEFPVNGAVSVVDVSDNEVENF